MTELMKKGDIFPIENSRLLSISPEGHVHLDISNATEMFADLVNNTQGKSLTSK
ncbi:hypothetical protein HYX09_04055 [Candidatus Woesearchaeota archaeon]|nr:hypothetical protein [Candidatus Woesearchaeota archaeon]